MSFSNHKPNRPAIFFNNMQIEHVETFKYLGFNLKGKYCDFDVNTICNDMKIKTNSIVNNFRQLDSNSKLNIFNSQCLSFYGCNLWDLQHKDVSRLELTWRKCSRLILDLPSRTHNVLIPQLMGTPDVKTTLQERFINFIIKGINYEDDNVNLIFRNSLIPSYSFLVKQINSILINFGLLYTIIFDKRKVRL